jgi:hypothetical protein
MVLLVNKVKASGSGTPNDGNTAKLKKKYWESARNTGVNENIILRLYVILQIISSGF